MGKVQRFGVSIEESLACRFDEHIRQEGYSSRSEALRDLIREHLVSEQLSMDGTGAVASLSLVYDHHTRDLHETLNHLQHDHHELIISTLHVHIDHENCLEAVVLRGETGRVRSFANQVMSQPGVRHGNLHLVPAEEEIDRHDHGTGGTGTPHVHSRPRT